MREREGRPALVVSSTSWTPDEDFGLLLKAAEVGLCPQSLAVEAAEVQPGTLVWHPCAGLQPCHNAVTAVPTSPTPPPPPLQLYDGRVRRSRHPGRYPRILFLVTGRGPQRQAYEERMRGLDLRHVAFRWEKERKKERIHLGLALRGPAGSLRV